MLNESVGLWQGSPSQYMRKAIHYHREKSDSTTQSYRSKAPALFTKLLRDNDISTHNVLTASLLLEVHMSTKQKDMNGNITNTLNPSLIGGNFNVQFSKH